MTGQHPDEALAKAQRTIEKTIARLAQPLIEIALSWVDSNTDVLPQLVGIQRTLICVAARMAGIIAKQYGMPIDLFAKAAQAEFDLVAAKTKAEPDSTDTGTRH
jgi:hypothetical protein